MNKVVITGAAGFVGSAVVKECLKNNVYVYAIDIVDSPKERLPLDNPNLVYIKSDISNLALLLDSLNNKGIDTFFHFAWEGSAGPKREDYECQVRNAILSVEIMKLAKKIGCNRFVFAGTIMEFEVSETTFAQGTKPKMPFIYGVGKSLAHQLSKPIANQIGIDLLWTYITNAYGVGELSPRLINTTIRKCINKEPLEFTAGTQNYDFVYIDDVAKAFYLIGEHGLANKSYLIGSGKAKPLKEFLSILVRICDKKAKPIFGNIPFTGVNQDIKLFSIKELQNDCGYKPSISFEEGIKRTYEWLKEME